MRTLLETIEAVKENRSLTIEEAIYTILALDALSTFDSMSLQCLAENPKSVIRTPEFEYQESFRRWKLALNKSPKDWVDWENDPANPEYQKTRDISLKIWNGIINKNITD